MNILFLVPQPFFQERGTPIAVKLLLETLSNMQYNLDLLTYHEGSNPDIDNLRIFRIPKLFFTKDIPVGFSWKKIICDILLSLHFFILAKKNHYHVVHAVEEAVFPALLMRYLRNFRLVYDMDSSMADQLLEKYPYLVPVRNLLLGFERLAIQKSDVIIPVCQHLADKVITIAPNKQMCVLEDVPLGSMNSMQNVEKLQHVFNSNNLMALYVGNLEHYQGIDLLLQGIATMQPANTVNVAIIGGKDSDILKYTVLTEKLGISQTVHFFGTRPLRDLPAYLSQADILVSPRIKGVNTPMKIYSYLASGKPILATRIPSHTQVLDSTCAVLVDPQPDAIAHGLKKLLHQSELRRTLASNGKRLAETKFSLSVYTRKLTNLYKRLQKEVSDENIIAL